MNNLVSLLPQNNNNCAYHLWKNKNKNMNRGTKQKQRICEKETNINEPIMFVPF